MFNVIKKYIDRKLLDRQIEDNFLLNTDDLLYLQNLWDKVAFQKLLQKIKKEIITTSLHDITKEWLIRRKHWLECLTYIEINTVNKAKQAQNKKPDLDLLTWNPKIRLKREWNTKEEEWKAN